MKTLLKLSLVLFAVACTPSVPQPVEPIETGPTHEGVWVCEDATGAPLSCRTDSDCCVGFACIKDPDGGRNDRVCTFDASM